MNFIAKIFIAIVVVTESFQNLTTKYALIHKISPDQNISSFYATVLVFISWKHKKKSGFLTFSVGIEWDQLHEMG